MIQIVAISALLLFLIWVSIHDIRTHKIENYTHLTIIMLAFFINDLTIAERIFSGLFCPLPFLTANILSGNKLGMGDVKLVTAFGFVIGAYGGLTAAITGLCLMLLTTGIKQKIKKQNKAVPLAPYLCGGFVIILILTMKG